MVISPSAGDENTNEDSCVAVIMQTVIDKALSGTLALVEPEIRLRKTLHGILSSPWTLVKVTEALLQTDALMGLVADVVKKETERVLETVAKREDRITGFAQTAKKKASVRLSQSSESRQQTSPLIKLARRPIKPRISTKNSDGKEIWKAEITRLEKNKN